MSHNQSSDGTATRHRGQGFGQEVETLKAEVAHVAHSAVGVARSGVDEIRHGTRHAIDAAKDQFDDVKESAARAARSASGFVERNPVASVGIALGLGVGLGVLIGLAAGRTRR